MKLGTDILYQELSKSMQVERSGKEINTLTLDPPVFWCDGMRYRSGMICIGRADELPEPPQNLSCLIISVGGRLPTFRKTSCCVFSIISEANLFRVFNLLQETFSRYEVWRENLEQIVQTTADLDEMLRITAPLLGNDLGICNKHLELIAHASPDGTVDSRVGVPLSQERVAKFADSHAQNISMRELFTFTMEGTKTYCLNIFTQDSYQGLLTISEGGEPITAGKLALYEFFFQYICKATMQRINKGSSRTITLKTVFTELVNCMPVGISRIARALSGEYQENREWLCLAAKPSKLMENIPTEYLCSQIEKILPKSVAIFQDPHIVVFVPEGGEPGQEEASARKLQQVVAKFFGCAGVSNLFWDLTEARFYYRQAVIALETAGEFPERPELCHFQDYALAYALRNSTGELAPEYILPRGLVKLRQEDEREKDYSRWDTLKTYLDNEMNATQTARDLYIHRTTLQNRLQKIESAVDLGSPESRMYIRYAMYLCELYERIHG